MTALILMLIWLSHVLPVVSEVPKPVNVTVNSSHFHHMVQWKAGVGTPPGVYYKVAFLTDKEHIFKPVIGCQHVQHPLVCNVTGVLSDQHKSYYTSVVAVVDKNSSKPATSSMFLAIRDTHLDPPLLTVTSCGRDLCLNLDPPVERMRATYGRFKYQLRIKSTNADEPRFREITSLKEEVFKDLPAGREYCASVKISGFLDSTEPRTFTFSQPKCAFIPGHLNTEPHIAAGLSFCVILILVVLAFLYCTGFICLKTTALPLVLTSIHHKDEFLHVPPLRSLPSILNVKPTAPSPGKRRSSQTESSDSEEESATEVTGGGGGRGRGEGYKLRVGTSLLSTSSSSSSSSLSAPLSPNCFPTNQNTLSVPPDVFSALPETPIAADTSTSASTSTADSLTAERPERAKGEGMREGDSPDVNLLTLTFGNHKEEKEEEPALVDLQAPPPASEETSVLLPHMCHFNEAAKDSDICSDDEEEEDEDDDGNGYMRR